MAGEGNASPAKQHALMAFEQGEDDARGLLEDALTLHPHDGALLIAHAAAGLRSGAPEPFARLEGILAKAPDWIEGHRALVRLKTEARAPNPFAVIEDALDDNPKSPRLWMAYLTLLGAAARHEEAAKHTADLRKTIADLPELRLVEARHRGFAGEHEAARALLTGLPESLPELGFERARNAMRLGDLNSASKQLERVVAKTPADTGAWALAELCWRASDDPRHDWLCPDDALFQQCDLGLNQGDLATLAKTLRALHVTGAAPLGQSVQGGTQTHGNLKLRHDPMIAQLFDRIDAALAGFAKALPQFPADHPLAALKQSVPKVIASWSILLTQGGGVTKPICTMVAGSVQRCILRSLTTLRRERVIWNWADRLRIYR